MFQVEQKRRTALSAAFEMAEVTFHATVRSARGSESNALFGLMMSVLMSAFFIISLYVTMNLLGFRNPSFHGDFMLFIISGVMPYMTYARTMRAVYSAPSSTSSIMLHGPMTTAISIISSAFGALYLMTLTTGVILFAYHLAYLPLSLNNPAYIFFTMLLAWYFGIATGMVLMAIRPWMPKFAPILLMIIARANIFASGKTMLGNTLSFTKLKLFAWNPLFHIIDQARGAFFINYSPRNSDIWYAVWVSLALMAIGLMGEFFTRKHASSSWSKL